MVDLNVGSTCTRDATKRPRVCQIKPREFFQCHSEYDIFFDV